MVKKFFKTYYSIPDKHNKIDIIFERGYRNIEIKYNNELVANFNSASELFNTKELLTADESLIHIKFLKDTAEFEVFLNSIQIDNSSNKPEKVLDSLKWPLIGFIGWQGIILMFTFARFPIRMIFQSYPEQLFFNPYLIFYLTLPFCTLITLVIGLIYMDKKKSTLVYYFIVSFMIADCVFSLILPRFAFSGIGVNLLFSIIPFIFKTVIIWVFVTNKKAFFQMDKINNQIMKGKNSDLVDLE